MKNVTMNDLEKKFSQRDEHAIWNWEKSPEGSQGNELIRYHFVLQGSRDLERKAERLTSNFNKKSIIHYSFEEKNRLEGRAAGTKHRYLFVSYDTKAPYEFLSFEGVSTNVRQDHNLNERKVLSIKDYVKRKYGK